ncbi:MAG TPA: PqqD family peptide modification chaperone [Anaerolineae bacterium]|nr:PqqD family peptide modification chaperone [Anaerolineae bacterium]
MSCRQAYSSRAILVAVNASPRIQLDSIVGLSPQQVSSPLADEMAVLNLENGVYYTLNRTGARVWEGLQEPRRVSELRDMLVRRYDVSPEQCERELVQLLENMAQEGLIEVRSEIPAT